MFYINQSFILKECYYNIIAKKTQPLYILAMLMISANTPAAVTPAPAPYP